MSDLTEIMKTISRVRRAMPRNGDVMLLCQELERLLVHPETNKPKFDRKTYQRELMRKRRAAGLA
jgi:uridine kinase